MTDIILTVNSNTWITLVNAETYFLSRLGSSSYWSATVTDEIKKASLVTAFRHLTGMKDFSLPITGTPADIVQYAQCEQALFLLVTQNELLSRKGLQAQGVVSAGVVKESYDKDMLGKIAISEITKEMLNAYFTSGGVYLMDIERDEDEDIDDSWS